MDSNSGLTGPYNCTIIIISIYFGGTGDRNGLNEPPSPSHPHPTRGTTITTRRKSGVGWWSAVSDPPPPTLKLVQGSPGDLDVVSGF